MYDIDNESLERWKIAFANDGIKYQTNKEYYEAIQNLTAFVDTLVDIDKNLKEGESTYRLSGDTGYLYDNDGNKIIL